MLLKNNMKIDDILKTFIGVYSSDGKRPRAKLAVIMTDVRKQFSVGTNLSSALAPWIPYQEMMMLRAGEEGSTLCATLTDIIRTMKKQHAIYSVIIKAAIYPSVLIIGASYVLTIIAQRVVPRLASVSDVNAWPPVSMLLMHISNFVNEFGKPFVGCLFILIGFVAWTIPNWSSRLPTWRIKMDSLPPYALYRILQGSIFLLNVSVMLKAQIQLVNILHELKTNASPWLKDRINAIQYNIVLGKSFGAALELSGYDFPDKRAVRFLKMLSAANGSEDAIYQYSEDWLDDAVEKVEQMAAVFLMFGILFIGLVVVLILIGIQGMSDSIVNH